MKRLTDRLTRDHELFSAFCRYLVRQEGFTADELLGVIEKPWNWTPEFRVWESDMNEALAEDAWDAERDDRRMG